MISKTKASCKRAPIPRASDRTKEFKKDWRRLNDAGRFDMKRAKRVLGLLVANDGPLPPEYKDHPLGGAWKGYRDCHIHGDFLLIYKLEGEGADEHVIFTRLGTHSELF